MDYQKIEIEFNQFLEQFDKANPKIAVKISHSKHVADLSNKLAKYLNLGDEQRELVKVIGLLHDVGRFLQIKMAGDYDDEKTKIDHGELGIHYLFSEGHIKDFSIPETEYHFVKTAISNHNKLQIQEELSQEELFVVQFIRDVDKIDIFRQNATISEGTFAEPVSENVKKAFFNHQLIDRKEIHNKTDMYMSQLAYLFDINFQESYELLAETDNLELYLSIASVDKGLEKEFEEVKKCLRDYLTERTKETC